MSSEESTDSSRTSNTSSAGDDSDHPIFKDSPFNSSGSDTSATISDQEQQQGFWSKFFMSLFYYFGVVPTGDWFNSDSDARSDGSDSNAGSDGSDSAAGSDGSDSAAGSDGYYSAAGSDGSDYWTCPSDGSE